MPYWPCNEYELADGRRFICLSFESAEPVDDQPSRVTLYRIFWTHPERRHQDVPPSAVEGAKHVRKL